jgi:hypothetical protein
MSFVSVDNAIVAKVRGEFNFSVDRFPISGPDGMRTPWYALFRSDSHEVVGQGSVSQRYVPHTTDDVLALVEAASAAFGGVADVNCGFRHGHFVSIQPTVEHRQSVFGTRDNVFPRIIINAGYGGTAFRASMGYWRDVCRNMHIMRQSKGTTVSIWHTSGLRTEMDTLIQQFSTLKESWGSLSALIESMEGRQVQMVEFLNAVYGEPKRDEGRAATIHRNRTEAIFRRLQNERVATGRPPMGSDFVVSAWEAFNSVQGFSQHEASRQRRPNEMGRVIRSLRDSAVRRAERVALEMAV